MERSGVRKCFMASQDESVGERHARESRRRSPRHGGMDGMKRGRDEEDGLSAHLPRQHIRAWRIRRQQNDERTFNRTFKSIQLVRSSRFEGLNATKTCQNLAFKQLNTALTSNAGDSKYAHSNRA